MTEFNKDHYRTPKYFVNWVCRPRLGHSWVDGCANSENALFEDYFGPGGIDEDFLNFDLEAFKAVFEDASIFVNPPYSDPMPFVKRAAELMTQGHLVVMLLPADKSTKWYKVIQENATEVIDIIGGRINFLHTEWKYFDERKQFDTFRKNLTVLAGYKEVTYKLDGSLRVEAQSLSYGNMEQDEFEKCYSALINAALKEIFGNTTDENVINQLYAFF